MRKTLAILLAAGAIATAPAALANRPVDPVVQLPSGDVVNLVTGIATTPAGNHYKLTAQQLHALIAKQAKPAKPAPPSPPRHAGQKQPPR